MAHSIAKPGVCIVWNCVCVGVLGCLVLACSGLDAVHTKRPEETRAYYILTMFRCLTCCCTHNTCLPAPTARFLRLRATKSSRPRTQQQHPSRPSPAFLLRYIHATRLISFACVRRADRTCCWAAPWLWIAVGELAARRWCQRCGIVWAKLRSMGSRRRRCTLICPSVCSPPRTGWENVLVAVWSHGTGMSALAARVRVCACVRVVQLP